jgi:carbamate kinase
MGPKVESVLRFLRQGGKEAVITSYEYLTRAVAGLAGTHILADAGTIRPRTHAAVQVGGR